jgi:pimeloyl-ACP methyl ester carboxylesterase
MDPKRCQKVVLIGPAGAKTDLTMHMLNERYNPFIHDTVRGVMDMYNLVVHSKPFIPRSVLYFFAEHNFIERRDALSHMFDDFVNLECLIDEKLEVDTRNVLFIWGEEDYFTPNSDIQIWQSLVGGHSIQYPGIGHMTMVECPKRTARDIRQFFS